MCAVGFEGYLDQLTLIDAAEAVGVKRFILSEFGNHPDQPCLPEFNQMLEPKTRVLEHARAKAEKNPRFSWSAVACGPFFDWVGTVLRFPFVLFQLQNHGGVCLVLAVMGEYG